jgi:hydroxymethylpyrimidine pyrophosphatase-like HAD family hydrolase
VEQRFREIGFDGYVCGCGTNIYCDGKDVLYHPQTHETIMKILNIARITNVDILFESRKEVCFDATRPLQHPKAIYHYDKFLQKGYYMPEDLENPNFFCDKFVIWYETPEQLATFRSVSDQYFECIDRGGTFREFVPHGFSKATGMKFVLDYYHLSLEDTYAFGDSNNDLAMLKYAPNSIAMGNSLPVSLFNEVSHVTTKASEDGIANALRHFGFI